MKKLVIMMTICLAMLLSTSVALADSFDIFVTYRDFEATHPDFGWESQSGSWYVLDSGIVGDTVQENAVSPALLVDDAPVYTGGVSGSHSTTGPDNFNDWYHNTGAGTLVEGRYLTFSETSEGSGMYQYNNDSFFPLDDLDDNDNNDDHNYYFTMELHSQFTYETAKNQIFTFEGDDDVFVYINDILVIDIGGVHGALSDSITLNDYASALGIEDGQNYAFDLFFAERNQVLSDFIATTNIAFNNPVVPVPGALLLGLLGFGATGMKLRKFA